MSSKLLERLTQPKNAVKLHSHTELTTPKRTSHKRSSSQRKSASVIKPTVKRNVQGTLNGAASLIFSTTTTDFNAAPYHQSGNQKKFSASYRTLPPKSA